MSSFSENVKEELLRTVPERPCCMLSELSAITRHSGSLILRGRGRMALRFHAPTTALAKRILVLLKRRLKIVPQIVFHEEHHFGRRRSVFLDLPEADTRRLLTALQMLKTGEGGLMLQRMSLRDVRFQGCQLDYAGFVDSRLQGVCFEHCQMAHTLLHRCEQKELALEGCVLEHAEIVETKLSGVDLSTCELNGLRAAIASLEGATLSLAQAPVALGLWGVTVKL